MKKLLLVTLLGLSTSVMAFGDNKANSKATAVNKTSVYNKVHTSQKQLQGQLQGQKQVNGNADNDQSVTVEGDRYREIPVSTAYAPSINPTATCMGSTTGGGQGMNVGISLGSSWESENCMILETARSFEQAGHVDDAMAVRCQTKYAKAAPSCIALANKNKPTDEDKVVIDGYSYSKGYWGK